MIEAFLGSTDASDPKVRRKLKILQGATELFIQQGYRKTSVDEIAQRAAVAKGTVYLYFKNKAEILLSAVAMEEREYLSRIKPILDGDLQPRDRLEQWLAQALALGTRMPLTSRLLGGDAEILAALEELPPEMLDRSNELTMRFTTSMVSEAAGEHDWDDEQLKARAAVVAGLSYFSGMLPLDPVRGGMTVERYCQVLARLIVGGVAGVAELPSASGAADPGAPGETPGAATP